MKISYIVGASLVAGLGVYLARRKESSNFETPEGPVHAGPDLAQDGAPVASSDKDLITDPNGSFLGTDGSLPRTP